MRELKGDAFFNVLLGYLDLAAKNIKGDRKIHASDVTLKALHICPKANIVSVHNRLDIFKIIGISIEGCGAVLECTNVNILAAFFEYIIPLVSGALGFKRLGI